MISYVRYNPRRKKQYQVVTTVARENSRLYYHKKACHESGIPFLDSLQEKYEYLAGSDLPLRVLKPGQSKDGLRFDFIDAQSLDSILYENVKRTDRNGIRNVFLQYKSLVDRIPAKKMKPGGADFESWFGTPREESDRGHLAIGCYDLILENIFADAGDYTLIDYEWTFGFPIPRKLVLFRTVLYAFYKYRHYNINQLVSADELFSEFAIGDVDIESLLEFEWNFQNSVNDNFMDYDRFTAANHALLYEKQVTDSPIDNYRRMIEEFSTELHHARIALKDKENTIAMMQASKFWKLRIFYVRMLSPLQTLRQRLTAGRRQS